MKKILNILFIFFILVALSGCNNINNTVNIDFIIGARSETIIKEPNQRITIDDIKTIDHDHITGMYYDIDYNNEYKNEQINNDITIYVKLIDGSKYYLEEKIEKDIIDKYYTDYCSSEADKQLVEFRYYFGAYNEGYVVLIINKTKGHPADGRGYQYNIVVYKNNMLIDIEDYMENIVLEDYIAIVSKSFELSGGIE